MKPWMKRNRFGTGVAIVGFWLGVIGLSLALSGDFPKFQFFPDVGRAVAALVTPTPVTGGTTSAFAMDEHAADEHANDDDPMTAASRARSCAASWRGRLTSTMASPPR